MSFVKIAKEFFLAVKGELDPHTTQKSEIKVKNFFTVELLTPAHIQFAKYGRGPGKAPPVDPILEWIRYKGIISGEKNIKGAAFAIAKSIGKNGTKNYVKNAPNALDEALKKHMRAYVEKLNKGHVVKITKEINEGMQKAIPEKINITV